MTNSNDSLAQGLDFEIKKRQGAYLPHWARNGAWYAVTFRLWDALPHHIIESWLFERKNILRTAEQMKRPLSEHEERRLAHLYSERVGRYLDAGYGACFMKDHRVAKVVHNALEHFEGQRYWLAAWCIMPNHVHVVVQPFAGLTDVPEPLTDLSEILHSWKSFTAKEANKLLQRAGEFWQAEYYDHLIRNPADLRHAVRYVLNNPNKAGLKDWKWFGISERGKDILGVD